MDRIPLRRALLSVSDKSGLVELAQALAGAGVELVSTGGTAQLLTQHGLPVREVSEYTGFPEMMHGRVKTLHPKVFGGILCRRDHDDDVRACREHGIDLFDLVVVNLYPFEETIARAGVTWEQAIEQIDIGGPSLVRAAAKNHAFTAVATDPAQYPLVVTALAEGGTTLALRQKLAAAAFAHTAAYDALIARWFAEQTAAELFPPRWVVALRRKAVLRYGENPHQQAAVYRDVLAGGPSLVEARQLHGKELSYNNLLDLDSALAIVRGFAEPAATVVKHNNPCGAAIAATLAQAAEQALAGDPQSAFGGVMAFNRPLDADTAQRLVVQASFLEALVAPGYEPAAVHLLTTQPRWKQNVRLMEVGSLERPPGALHLRAIEGGMLVQEADIAPDVPQQWKVVTRAAPDPACWNDLRFAWGLVRHVKSNAIVLARQGTLVGCGAGQMSRVDSVEIALRKAGPRAAGAVLASDAFFPFPDSIELAAAAGVAAIIQPGGSVRDAEVIAAADAHNLPMLFTGRRHFKH
jgi:phosphoribosylaminoimidazolecarboxamide formyltransferase/IMP cyclohydrolase